MEEVDNIIIHTLKNIGCDIDEEIVSLKQFTDEIIVKAVICCLEAITPGTGLPKILPASMSLRLRTATSIAEMIKDLGYRGDMGYQTLLYSNEVDIRRMFMFLVERLPRDTDKAGGHVKVKGRFEILMNDIRAKITNDLKKKWKPELMITDNIPFRSRSLTVPETFSKNISEDKKEYWNRYLLPITEQCTEQELIPSLIVLNEIEESKVGQISREESLHALNKQTNNISEAIDIQDINTEITLNKALNNTMEDETVEKMKSLSVDDIKNTIQSVTDNVHRLKDEIQTLDEELKILKRKETQILEQKKIEDELLENNVKQLKIKSRSYKLLPSKDENVQKLEEMIQASTEKLTNLANQWNKHRTTLIEEYRNLREISTLKDSESYKIEEEFEQEKQKSKELEKEIAIKNVLHKQLQDEVAQLSKTVNRFAYTHRIMEIIGNIRKQCTEMDKILEDTKQLQKDINKLTGKLDRSYVLTDEMIYRDAKQEETSRKAYKLLVTLHSDCNDIIEVAKQTGSIVREIRDLQEQVDTEKSYDIGARIDRITADLEQVRKETTTLQQEKMNRKS
ncbi:coiled-coil domain-containing protein 22 homolog [Chrysoperla carnea]|uniref:coiled-coil domain-containing protein 22 homolog n=1 Tax=Chrysoperla carnea TaxID=189513 RepID=UPI001D070B80|nr:coiled-coil domain-containing protein 22 homolog [Chrysoperla carnea]